MQKTSIKLAVAFGVASAIKYGTRLATTTMFHQSCHAILEEFPTLKESYPSLAIEISQLGELGQDGKFRAILRILEDIVVLDKEERKGNEFKIARLIGRLEAGIAQIADNTQAWKSDSLFNEKRIAQQDTIPTVKRQVENILHNFITRCS